MREGYIKDSFSKNITFLSTWFRNTMSTQLYSPFNIIFLKTKDLSVPWNPHWSKLRRARRHTGGSLNVHIHQDTCIRLLFATSFVLIFSLSFFFFSYHFIPQSASSLVVNWWGGFEKKNLFVISKYNSRRVKFYFESLIKETFVQNIFFGHLFYLLWTKIIRYSKKKKERE